MTMITIQSIWSIVILVTFLGIIYWAYSGKRKADFEEASLLPLEDDIVAKPNNKSPE